MGSTQRQRQNIRNFKVSDTFEGLITKVGADYCPPEKPAENFIYPIAGSIGMSELVGAFLDLNQSGGLSGPKDAANVPTIADTIAFTTTVTASANPKIVLTPIGRGLHFADAGLTADAIRADVHKVIIAISLPLEPVNPKKKGAAQIGRASAERGAKEMIEYQVYRNLLNTKIFAIPE